MATYEITDLESKRVEIVETFNLRQATEEANKLFRYYEIQKVAYREPTINRWNINRGISDEI